jgi:uncharacterized membrane protein YsdA (DUF1294 family)
VTFLARKGKDGRFEAQSVAILGANPKSTPQQLRRGTEASTQIGWRLPLAGTMAILLLVGLALGRLPWQLALAYVAMGLIAFVAYGRDKRLAESGRWRISEATLLGLDFCFGLLGGLLGQQLFRHKTRKRGYVATTVLISAIHLLWLGGLALGFIGTGEISDLLADFTRTILIPSVFHVNP